MAGRLCFVGRGAFLALAILLAAGTALGQESDGDDRGRRDNFDGVERSGGTFRERVRERLDSVRESSRGRPRASSFESDDGPRPGSSQQDVGDMRERIRQQFRSSRDEQVRLKSQESIEVEKERIKRLDEKYKPKTGAVSEQEGGSDGATAQPPARSADASVESGDRQVSEPLSSAPSSRSGNFVEPPAAHWGQKLASDQADAATKADEAMVTAKLEEREREREREGSRPMGMPDRGHAATTTAPKSSLTSSGERSVVTQALLDELERKNRGTPPTLEGKIDGVVEIMAFVSRMGEGDKSKMQASIEGIYQRAKSLATQLPTLVVHETPAPVNPSSSPSFTSSSARLPSPSEGQPKLPEATGTAIDTSSKIQTSSTSSSSGNRASDVQGEKTSGTN